MLTWLRLFVATHGLLEYTAYFIPLGLVQLFDLSPKFSYLVSATFALRMTSSVWVLFLDSRPALYGPLLGGLSLTSAACWIIILCIPTTSHIAWIALFFTVYSASLQPLTVLVDSVILKVLGDYRMLLFATYRQWSVITAPLLTLVGFVHWLTYPQPLLVLLTLWTAIITLIFTCICWCWVTTEPMDPNELNTTSESAPYFLKNAPQLSDTRISAGPTSLQNPLYKPYSLFGEELSHISEEDASLLQRMNSTHSLMQNPSRTSHYSYDSTVLSGYHGTFSESNYFSSAILSPNAQSRETPFITVPVSSLDLALLILPYPQDPMAVLLLLPPSEEYRPCHHDSSLFLWKVRSLFMCMGLMGGVSGMLNSLLVVYLVLGLGMPIWLAGIAISVQAISVSIGHSTARWCIRRYSLFMLSGSLHGLLIGCAIGYGLLLPNHTVSWVASIFLQGLQALCLHLIWCIAIYRMNALVWVDHQRIIGRGTMSIFYSSLGPCLGALLVGIVVNDDPTWRLNFLSIFHGIVPITILSFVISWGWIAED
ncbi:hypothetical protein BDF14DRAFT_1760271 [Spinellus fusiger]|nr:hypothetical protein BDF14DRAFT_1760271 [Spinellus fusiger]